MIVPEDQATHTHGMSNQNRQSPGTPSGGQFAASSHDEADVVLAAKPAEPVPAGVKRHEFESSGEAYDICQTGEVADGGLLVVPSEKVAGFLFRAWPVAVSDEPGSFHEPADGFDAFLAQYPKYEESYRAAKAIVEAW